MKKIFLFFLVLLTVFQMKATGQSGDIIYLEGEEWVLMAKPIAQDSLLRERVWEFLPENRTFSTNNWSGYTAFWEVSDGYIYLRRMEVAVYDKVRKKRSTMVYEANDLQELFASYFKEGKIQATWFSGELRAGKGKVVKYVHDGFERNMETECVLTILNGKVLNTKTYHNNRKDGLDFIKAKEEMVSRFPWEQFPEYRGQRIIFRIRNCQLTADGHFVDCDVHSIHLRSLQEDRINDENNHLALAFKETLKSIYPWEVFFINGKYTNGHRDWFIPLQEKDINTLPDKKDSALGTTAGK